MPDLQTLIIWGCIILAVVTVVAPIFVLFNMLAPKCSICGNKIRRNSRWMVSHDGTKHICRVCAVRLKTSRPSRFR